jgi:uncharacterized membrane protein YtjA (UPF0391 family)
MNNAASRRRLLRCHDEIGNTLGKDVRRNMLRFSLAFLLIALIAAALQYFGVAAAMASVARMVFFIFMLLFLFCLAGHIYRGS